VLKPLKVDDDTFVNPSVLWGQLEHALLHSTTTKTLGSYTEPPKNEQVSPSPPSESVDYLFMGILTNDGLIADNKWSCFITTGHIMKSTVPIRDVGSKWYLPSRFYPLNVFPHFASGSGYIFSTRLRNRSTICLIK